MTKLQIKRGLDTGRTFTPASGELIFATDTKRMFIGDGSTAGGIGLCPLDSNSKISTSYLPVSFTGQVHYNTVWNASTNTPTLPSASADRGGYYIVSAAGTYNSTDYQVGDWVISDGTNWSKVDNTDSISSWNGRTGAITPLKADYSAWFLDKATADTYYLTSASNLAWGKLTGVPSTFTPSAHTHVIADTTGLQAALDSKQPTGAYLLLTSPLTGYAVGSDAALAATDTILGAYGKIQAQLNTKFSNTVSRTANTVLAAPNGSAGVASFRTLVAADIPVLDWSKITTGKPTTLAGYGITDAVGSSDSRLTDARTPINNANYVFGDNGSGTRLGTATSSSQATLRKSGFYSNSSWTDAPVANTWTHLIHNQYVNDAGSSNGWSFDIAANFGSAANPGSAENYYMRCIANGITTGWRKLWHDGNFTPGNYLLLSGGTMANDAVVTFNRVTYGESVKTSGNSWTGMRVSTSGSGVGAYSLYVTPSVGGSYWAVQKRDAADFGTTAGCFAIEDNSAGNVAERFALWIAAGASGMAQFNRRVKFYPWTTDYSGILLNSPSTCWGGIIMSGTGTDQTMMFAQVDSAGKFVRKTNINANALVLDGAINTGNGSVFGGDITVNSCVYTRYVRVNSGWSGNGSETFIVGGNGRFTDYLAVNGRLYANDCSINGTVFGSDTIGQWNTVYSKMDNFVQGNGNGLYGRRSTNISSFDTLLKSGFYDMNAAGPFGTTWQHLIRSTHTDPSNGQDKWSFDIAAAFANGNGSEGYKMRVNTSAGWGAWRTIWTDLNLNQNCSTNQAPTFAGLTVSGQINATDTVNGILFGGNGRIWRDSRLNINDPTTISLRIDGSEKLGINGTSVYTSYKLSAPEFKTSWGINGAYNWFGQAGGNTNQWATTGGFATNTVDTWIGGTNSFNVWAGGVTNVIVANSTNVTIGRPLYCSELHSTGSYAGTGLFAGTGDGATTSTYNQKITSWYGTGIYDACNNVCTGYIDHRLGRIWMKQDIIAQNSLYGGNAIISNQLNVAGYMLLSKQTITANTNIVIDVTSPVITFLNQDNAINVSLPNSSNPCVKYIVNVSGRTCTVSSSVTMFINGAGFTPGSTWSFASNGKPMTCINIGGMWCCSC